MNELIRDHMTEAPVSVREDESVGLAYRLLREKNFRHLPVINEKHRVVGIISDRDVRSVQVTANALLQGYEEALDRIRIEDIMSQNIQSITPDDSLQVAASFMIDYKFNALPVIDNNELVGIITSTDVLKAIRVFIPKKELTFLSPVELWG